ncbi:hypothetical protein T069G_06072 [Trichoderma breve]|uniref:DUF1445 domain-containing protein n=1 Tax=Trichoderma breve TaxID=2034170 RepID=A0A9W9BGS6_9HYPO|nr:hypothetical protein T069G_06072 [Trichoderma breve]KAJ4861084.1 hypothetical protein T069G_06072 [Trichoderma breve]
MNTSIVTGQQARLVSRNNKSHKAGTSGLAPGYLQANLIILPSRYANDFRNLCARNPVPCPLIAESATKGCDNAVISHIDKVRGDEILGEGCDIRRDAPHYMVYKDSKLEKSHCNDVVAEWTDDHVAFLIGCSYSFETALAAVGLPPRQLLLGRNVPMYRTTLRLCPSGVFQGGTYVVSMRPYKRRDVERVREITRRFGATHGEPLDWGWEAVERLGIRDIDGPEWGDAPMDVDGKRAFGETKKQKRSENKDDKDEEDEEEIPVFWGCGVTPQEAVMRAGLEGVVMAHAPGHMLVLDARDEDLAR